ncbi:hypothetical protein ACFQ1I_33895 [Kitasatospora arboriphila]
MRLLRAAGVVDALAAGGSPRPRGSPAGSAGCRTPTPTTGWAAAGSPAVRCRRSSSSCCHRWLPAACRGRPGAAARGAVPLVRAGRRPRRRLPGRGHPGGDAAADGPAGRLGRRVPPRPAGARRRPGARRAAGGHRPRRPAARYRGDPAAGEPGDRRAVRARITGLLDELADGGLGAAEDALGVLETLLDRPTATALDGIEEALAAVDLTGPLLRTLRAGLPEELGWPALDEALADLGAPPRHDHHLAGAHPLHPGPRDRGRPPRPPGGPRPRAARGRRAARRELRRRRPAGGLDDRHQAPVHLAGVLGVPARGGLRAARATGLRTWSATACQFETADRTGRHDGARILRPGDRDGLAASRQLSDGTTVWSRSAHGDEDWDRLDPATGGRTGAFDRPAFAAAPVPDGHRVQLLSLVALPPDADADASPLGHRAGLAGFRVLRGPEKDARGWDHRLEGTDGRTAGLRAAASCEPWAVARMPGGGAECVLTDPHRVHCHDAQDGSLLWRAGGDVPVLPPPPFWHFLAPRDPASSRALRAAGREAAAALLAADEEATAAGIARLLPEVTDRRIAEGAARTVRAARAALHRREELSARVAAVRSGRLAPLAETSDVRLLAALRGLLDVPGYYRAEPPSPQPATLTALAADGAHLAGRLGEAERRLSPPARARDWTPLLGRIDAAAWRLVTAATAEEDRPSPGRAGAPLGRAAVRGGLRPLADRRGHRRRARRPAGRGCAGARRPGRRAVRAGAGPGTAAGPSPYVPLPAARPRIPCRRAPRSCGRSPSAGTTPGGWPGCSTCSPSTARCGSAPRRWTPSSPAPGPAGRPPCSSWTACPRAPTTRPGAGCSPRSRTGRPSGTRRRCRRCCTGSAAKGASTCWPRPCRTTRPSCGGRAARRRRPSGWPTRGPGWWVPSGRWTRRPPASWRRRPGWRSRGCGCCSLRPVPRRRAPPAASSRR